MTASRSTAPPAANRALGLVGMLGGLGLLAAFVIDFPGTLNTIRIVLFTTPLSPLSPCQS